LLGESLCVADAHQITYEELPEFSEVMAAGTAAALVPIKSITMKSKGDTFKYQGGGDEPGPVIVKLLSILKGIQQGKMKDEFGWLAPVEEPKGYEVRGAYESKSGENTNGYSDDVDKLP